MSKEVKLMQSRHGIKTNVILHFCTEAILNWNPNKVAKIFERNLQSLCCFKPISNITDICKYNFLSVFSRQLDSNSKLDLFIHVWYSCDFLLLLYNIFLVCSSVVFIFSPLFIITSLIVIIIAIKITSGWMRLWKEEKKEI